jgi:hypothetical protein
MDESATAADGARKGWMQSSTCRAVDQAGRAAGREYGLAEAMARECARLLGRQAKQKFGDADPTGRATLDALAQAFAVSRLQELAESLVTAPSWVDWLAGVVAPPPAPGLPDYTKGLEIDLEPASPSIDIHMRVGKKGGGDEILHIRMQKWYQPGLEQHLSNESRKLERKHGKAPVVMVILLWPPAEGPDMTGRYEERDAGGRVKHVFTYTLRRAWEMEPEEVARSPGTIMLAPLARGARQRLPEVIRMVEKGLGNADTRTRELAWGSVYWTMGLICELDEAHRVLGDHLSFIQQSHEYLSAKGHAFLEAYSAAQSNGPPRAARELLLRQARRRFGEISGAADALEAITALDELEALAQRVLTAADWSSLLASR